MYQRKDSAVHRITNVLVNRYSGAQDYKCATEGAKGYWKLHNDKVHHLNIVCEIPGSLKGAAEDLSLLGCYAMSTAGKQFSTFRRIVLSPL